VADCGGKCVGFGQVGYHGSCCADSRLCGTNLKCDGGNCVCDEGEQRLPTHSVVTTVCHSASLKGLQLLGIKRVRPSLYQCPAP